MDDDAKELKSNVAVFHTVDSLTHTDLNLSRIYSNIKLGVKSTANNSLEFTDKSRNSREGNINAVRLSSVVEDASHKNQSSINTEFASIQSDIQVNNIEKQKFEEKSTNISVPFLNDSIANKVFSKSTLKVKHMLPKSENASLASVPRVESIQKENRSLISTFNLTTDDQNQLIIENKLNADDEVSLNGTTSSKNHYRINTGSRKESLFQEIKLNNLKLQNQSSLNDTNNKEVLDDRNENERNNSNLKAKQEKNFLKYLNNLVIDDNTDPKDVENADLEFKSNEEDNELVRVEGRDKFRVSKCWLK